jgi:hypothetical protein
VLRTLFVPFVLARPVEAGVCTSHSFPTSKCFRRAFGPVVDGSGHSQEWMCKKAGEVVIPNG